MHYLPPSISSLAIIYRRQNKLASRRGALFRSEQDRGPHSLPSSASLRSKAHNTLPPRNGTMPTSLRHRSRPRHKTPRPPQFRLPRSSPYTTCVSAKTGRWRKR